MHRGYEVLMHSHDGFKLVQSFKTHGSQPTKLLMFNNFQLCMAFVITGELRGVKKLRWVEVPKGWKAVA